MDIYILLSPDEASYYQTTIGVMRWVVKLGSIDIFVEVSQISFFLAVPRKGHMVSALHIISYLRSKHNSCLALDPSYAHINLSEFKSDENWTAFYKDAVEAKPHNYPKSLGKEIEL